MTSRKPITDISCGVRPGKSPCSKRSSPACQSRTGEATAITPAHLDLLSVHKASRAISAKIEVGDFIQTMMTIVMESAGADRGALLLEIDGEWQIEASADLGTKVSRLVSRSDMRYQELRERGFEVPSSVINYVLRTQALLAISEPARDPRFGQDAYVTRVVPRSVLCVPVINQGRTTGIIYLENKLGSDVFSLNRRDVMDVLAGQIAISLENATLYADMKTTVAKQLTHDEGTRHPAS